jgi:hypothetical protein
MVKSKKSQLLFTQGFLVIFSILAIVIILILGSLITFDAFDTYETSSPEISYSFPAVFTYTFLNQPISQDYVEVAGYGEDKSKAKIYYLLTCPEDYCFEEAEKFRDEYLEEMFKPRGNSGNNIMYFFSQYSKKEYNKNDMLKIETIDDLSIVKDLDDYILDTNNPNYYYIIPVRDGKYRVVYFVGD